MAGVGSMGDLSHELETAIGQIEHGAITPDESVTGTLQAGLDELARMRDRHRAEAAVVARADAASAGAPEESQAR